MGKLVLFLSFVSLGLLFVLSIVAPNSSAIWLASTTLNFELLRAGVMALLLLLLVTDPPRNPYLRAFVGAVSLAIIGWSLESTYNNQMELLDSMALLTTGISSLVTALEYRQKTDISVTHIAIKHYIPVIQA